MHILRQINKGRLALVLVLILVGVLGVTLAGHSHRAGRSRAAAPPAHSTLIENATLHPAQDAHNPYGLPYRNTPARTVTPNSYAADAVYFPTEKGRSVVCLASNLGWQAGVLSCDWAGYHDRYGPGDPFDQR